MGTCSHVMVDGNLVTLWCMSALVTLWRSTLFIPLWRYLGRVVVSPCKNVRMDGKFPATMPRSTFVVSMLDWTPAFPPFPISLPVWTSDFPPYPLPMPSWTANFPPLCCVRLSWSQWSIGHWHSRHSPHLLISIPVWRSDFPPFPLQCPSGQLISCHTAYSTFNFRVSMLDWTLAFPPFSAFECPHGQPISRYYFPNTTTATIINTTEQNHPFDSTTPVSNTCKYGHNSARHWW